jgi:hypothetical protein
MALAIAGTVIRELVVLLVVAAIGHKAPDDFYLGVFLLCVLAYRNLQQRGVERDIKEQRKELTSDKVEAADKINGVWSITVFVANTVLLIAVLVVAFR